MNGDAYKEQQNDLYENNSDPWANITVEAPRYRIYQQYHGVIVAMILPRYKTVVDIGCGVGGLVNLINASIPPENAEAIGVDSSEIAIQEAKRHSHAQFEVGDIRYWKPDTNVDMVLSTGPYYHLSPEERLDTLKHIKSYLNPGGALLIAYGGDMNLDGEKIDYPDLSHEIFSVFKKQQYLSYMYKDIERDQQGSYVFYVGEK